MGRKSTRWQHRNLKAWRDTGFRPFEKVKPASVAGEKKDEAKLGI